MKTYFDCIPCFLRQALDIARLVTDDEDIHEQVLKETLYLVSKMDLKKSPPQMSKRIHELIRNLTENLDPYKEIKLRFNEFALGVYAQSKKLIEESDDPLETAVRLAIAGNIIDFGVKSSLENHHVQEALDQALTGDMDPNAFGEFKRAIEKADNILYLGDNAGEIVFDKLLIEQLPKHKVTFVVRGRPIINDVTMADAKYVGLTDLVEVIDNGDDAPGTILDSCSESFRQRFKQADLVISKGQGNYETLSEYKKNIFFILKAKCPVISRHLECEPGAMVLCRGTGLEKITIKVEA
jgi:damage-control phosphatase, subfamily I